RFDRGVKMCKTCEPASQIADELGGVSRNAVIGKAHRLGLEARPSPVKPGEEKEHRAPAAAAPAPKAAPVERAVPKAAAPTPAPAAPGAAAPATSARRPQSADAVQYRSIGPGGFIRQGPGEQQAPIPPAPPRRLVPAKPSPGVAEKNGVAHVPPDESQQS